MDSLNHQQQQEIEPTLISIISLDRSLEHYTEASIRDEILQTRAQLFEELVDRISRMVGSDKAQGIANLAIEEADLHSTIPACQIEQLLIEISSILDHNETTSTVA
jgi:hypothetical protein